MTLSVRSSTWREPPGFIGWFRVVNHKQIGKRFMITAFIFFLLGGILAALMRNLKLNRFAIADGRGTVPIVYSPVLLQRMRAAS